MKLFVAIITFVVVPTVFADDFAWESVSDWPLPPDVFVYEVVPAPKRDITQSADDNVKTQEASRSSQEVPPLVSPQPSAHPLQPTKTDDSEKEKEKLLVDRIANDIQRDFVVVTVFAGLFQVIILAVQVWFARSATRYAGDAAIAAKISADTALAQTKIMESRERPWMVVTPGDPDGGWPVRGVYTSPFQFKFKWTAKNVGVSPAFMTRLSVDAKVVDWPIPNERPPYPETGNFAEFVIASDKTHESRRIVSLTQPQVENFLSGQSVVAFYGIIEYHGPASGPCCTRFYTYWGGPNGMKIFSPVGPPKTVDYKCEENKHNK